MTRHTWIRCFYRDGKLRRDPKTLRLTDAAAAALGERIGAAESWIRAGEQRELVSLWKWIDIGARGVQYVRAEPSTGAGRQERDQLIGPELIRRFDLTPHITVHLADGVTLWAVGAPSSQTAEAWARMNEPCPVACDARYVVGTHASNDFNEVTCKACRSGRRRWLRFSTCRRVERFDPVVEPLTDEQVRGLYRHAFRRMVTCQRELVYFELGDGLVQTHYVLLEPTSQSGWRERDEVLGDEYVARFVHVEAHELAEAVAS